MAVRIIRTEFRENLADYYPMVLNVCRTVLSFDNRHLIEDVAQDAMILAWRKFEQFEGRNGGDIGAWLRKIARNTALSTPRLRRYRFFASLPQYIDFDGDHTAFNVEFIIDSAANPLSRASTAEFYSVLDRVVGSLPKRYREAFVLRYEKEVSPKDMAHVLGISVAATKTRLFRSVQLIRRELLALGYRFCDDVFVDYRASRSSVQRRP